MRRGRGQLWTCISVIFKQVMWFSRVEWLTSNKTNVTSDHIGRGVPTQIPPGAPRAAPREGHGGKAVWGGTVAPPHHACRVPEGCPAPPTATVLKTLWLVLNFSLSGEETS